MPVAPRIVNDVSYVRNINHESHLSWQAQYLARLEGESCCSAHCNDVSYVADINHGSHFASQVQYLVTFEDESFCSAHCK